MGSALSLAAAAWSPPSHSSALPRGSQQGEWDARVHSILPERVQLAAAWCIFRVRSRWSGEDGDNSRQGDRAHCAGARAGRRSLRTKDSQSSGMGAVIFTVMALLFTGITAWLLAMMLAGSEYSKEPVQTEVVAKGDLEPLRPIAEDDLRITKMPISSVPDGAFSTVEELVTEPPKRSLVFIHDGEILLRSRLADPTRGQGLASFIPAGMRAMVVNTDVSAALARLIYPGATVDVVATMRIDALNTTVTHVILQKVKVVAIGTDVDPAHLTKSESSAAQSYSGKPVEDKDTVVTLLVTPEQAEKLTLASRRGRIDMVLRNPADTKPTEGLVGMKPEDLFPALSASEQADQPRRARRSRPRPRPARNYRSSSSIEIR